MSGNYGGVLDFGPGPFCSTLISLKNLRSYVSEVLDAFRSGGIKSVQEYGFEKVEASKLEGPEASVQVYTVGLLLQLMESAMTEENLNSALLSENADPEEFTRADLEIMIEAMSNEIERRGQAAQQRAEGSSTTGPTGGTP